MLKVVFDTNIYISAISYGGKPRYGMELARKGLFRLFVSPEILEELEEELTEPPFNISKRDIKKILSGIKKYVKIIKPTTRVNICRDVKDNMLLNCAIDSMSRYLVTGDKDLLVIEKIKNIDIVSISQFMENKPWE